MLYRHSYKHCKICKELKEFVFVNKETICAGCNPDKFAEIADEPPPKIKRPLQNTDV